MDAERSARKGERGRLGIPMVIAIVGLIGAGSLVIGTGSAMARAVGINQIAIAADSTAAISAMGTLKAGKGEFAVGREDDSFNTHDCSANESGKFFPTHSKTRAGDSGRGGR